MPKVDWSPTVEKGRCFHRPLCHQWQTKEGRKLRICRMSATHLDSAIIASERIMEMRRREVDQAIYYADSDLHPMASAIVLGFVPDLEEDVYHWLDVIEVLGNERDRRK